MGQRSAIETFCQIEQLPWNLSAKLRSVLISPSDLWTDLLQVVSFPLSARICSGRLVNVHCQASIAVLASLSAGQQHLPGVTTSIPNP
jgi:hypothetical protein